MITDALLDNGFEVDVVFTPEHVLRDASREGRLICYCGDSLKYRHGAFKTQHFAHKGNRTCGYESPETIEHKVMREFFFRNMQRYDKVEDIKMEKKIDRTRPDVYVEVRRERGLKRVGIEVQHSAFARGELREKLHKNTEDGIYTLYVLDACSKSFLRRAKKEGGNLFNIVDSELKLHFYNLNQNYYFDTQTGRLASLRLEKVGEGAEDKGKREITQRKIITDLKLKCFTHPKTEYLIAGFFYGIEFRPGRNS
jgi:competence CoiA-like predicted nuclease